MAGAHAGCNAVIAAKNTAITALQAAHARQQGALTAEIAALQARLEAEQEEHAATREALQVRGQRLDEALRQLAALVDTRRQDQEALSASTQSLRADLADQEQHAQGAAARIAELEGLLHDKDALLQDQSRCMERRQEEARRLKARHERELADLSLQHKQDQYFRLSQSLGPS